MVSQIILRLNSLEHGDVIQRLDRHIVLNRSFYTLGTEWFIIEREQKITKDMVIYTLDEVKKNKEDGGEQR